MALIINKDQLQRTGTGWKFEGFNFTDANISFFIIEAAPERGQNFISIRMKKFLSILKAKQHLQLVMKQWK